MEKGSDAELKVKYYYQENGEDFRKLLEESLLLFLEGEVLKCSGRSS